MPEMEFGRAGVGQRASFRRGNVHRDLAPDPHDAAPRRFAERDTPLRTEAPGRAEAWTESVA